MTPSDTQKEIINLRGNLVVSASAGTGKTFTMVEKIAKEIDENRTHKVIAAITFTIKAAQEIKDRLTIDSRKHFIGTNNSFAIEEIIKPFMKDVYGEKLDVDMTTDYTCKIDTYENAVEKIKEENKIYSYNDSKKNFVFELALNIVKQSKVCRLYLKSKYFKLYIDEYQDCDKSMHDFFMYLCDILQIETFIVGDDKQSIYMWRGAFPEAFKSIWNKPNFKFKFLGENYRSCQQIQNYSNLLCEETRPLYKPLETNENIIFINTTASNWQNDIQQYLDNTKKTALLRYSNANAESNSNELNKLGLNYMFIPQLPIADITTYSAWMYLSVAKFILLTKFSVFDFIMDIPVEGDDSKRVVKIIENYLNIIKEKLTDKNRFYTALLELSNYLDYPITKEHCDKLFDTIIDNKYHSAFNVDKYKNIAITFHSSKGLEFNQVIIFAEDYKLNDQQSIYNHYVACTRAKNRLIIIGTENYAANLYKKNLTQIFISSNLKVEEVVDLV